MSRERVLQRRLQALRTLEEAVGALRSLSAQHFRAARAPLAAARAYRAEVQRFLGVLAAPGPAAGDAGPTGIVLVAADLGLVGEYTTRLVRESLALREEAGPGPLVCLGRRAVPHLMKAGVEPDAVHEAPSTAARVTAFLLPIVDTLLALQRRHAFRTLWLVAARFEGAGAYRPVRVPVLPVVAPADGEPLPASPYCDGAHLRAVVVREYLYASLHETLLDALASEHGKRLVTAETARSWLEDRIAATRRQESALRREASTQEVLEIAAAARAAERGPGAAP